MDVQTFSGTHFQMGEQQGKAYAGILKSGMETIKNLEHVELAKPSWMPRGLFIWLASMAGKRAMVPILGRHAPNQLERAKGIAKGAGIPFRLACLFMFIEIAFGENDYEIPVAQGCTTVMFRRALVDSGHVTIARNFDYASFVVPFLVARRNEPEGYYKSMDITAAPLPGTFNGFNEEGVFLSTNEAFPIAEGIRKPGLSASLLIQEALETCSTVQDVVKLFRRKPRGSCNIVTVADKHGELVSLEYTSNELHEVYPGEGEEFLVATNHYVTPELARIDLPRNAVFGKKAPRSLHGVCINETSFVRRETVRGKIASLGSSRADLEWMMALLRDHSACGGKGGMETICHHDPENISAASMVIDLEDLVMWACKGLPCENEFEKVWSGFGEIKESLGSGENSE